MNAVFEVVAETMSQTASADLVKTRPKTAKANFVGLSTPDIAEDLFEEVGASTALLKLGKDAEPRLVIASMSRRFTGATRSLMLKNLAWLLKGARVQDNDAWFMAVSLLDRSGVQDELDLPAVCYAIVYLLAKSDCGVKHRFGPEWLDQLVMRTANGIVTSTDVKAWEQRLLENVQWRVLVPTAETWSTTFVMRLDILTGKGLSPMMSQMFNYTSSCIRTLEVELPDHGIPPLQLAMGLTAFGLVCARALPRECVLGGSGPTICPCRFPETTSRRILELLLDAVCCEHPDLCRACRLVADLPQALPDGVFFFD